MGLTDQSIDETAAYFGRFRTDSDLLVGPIDLLECHCTTLAS